MWYAVESSKPLPPPPVSKPSFGGTSPWLSQKGQGTEKPGNAWKYSLAVVAQNNSAMLYFNAPANTGGTDVIDYTAEAFTGGASTGIKQKFFVPPAAFPGLKNGVEYTFKLVARNKMGKSDVSLASPPVTPHDVVRQALKDIYTLTGGTGASITWRSIWLNDWDAIKTSDSFNYCCFFGVTCSGTDVIGLTLNGEGTKKMTGNIPATIGNLKELQTLNLNINSLKG